MNDILRMFKRIDHSPMYLYIESLVCLCVLLRVYFNFNSRVLPLCLCGVFAYFSISYADSDLYLSWSYFILALFCVTALTGPIIFQVNRYLIVIVLITCSPLYLYLTPFGCKFFLRIFLCKSVIFFLIVIMYLLL